jgi:hypothetical protein
MFGKAAKSTIEKSLLALPTPPHIKNMLCCFDWFGLLRNNEKEK